SAFNARYTVTWVGSSGHFEKEFNRVKHRLHTVLREGKNEMERNYIESTDESVVNTQDQGEISTERYKKRFSNSSRVKDVVLWIETLKPTFLSCNDPVIIYALRGGVMPERELKKVKV
ncbi:hypothetical protein PRIPAC_91856, partial [Pristionchus pacificus]|uniref:Uncharacterized protein n=1 Tax=Pristionchus pacificus TaxID=54126 RepID=A0A2A6CIB8_PRIPA